MCEKKLKRIWQILHGHKIRIGQIMLNQIKKVKSPSNSCSSIKDPSDNTLSNKNKILSRWREYFEDLLNPVKVTNVDTHETICFQ